jgi:D-arabinose 1-dehydrogenase-like Zn-dependent alcohol dehydrogenase
MRIFLAGATGVIGIRLVPLLVADHTVAGMTRSPEKIEQLQALGAEPVVCDVLDPRALTVAITDFKPDAVLHQVTDLPERVGPRGRWCACQSQLTMRAITALASECPDLSRANVGGGCVGWTSALPAAPCETTPVRLGPTSIM